MATVNPITVQEGLIRFIRDYLGYRLSDMPSLDTLNPLKAVIKDRVKGPRPDYPFIVVEVVRSSKALNGTWLRDVEVNIDNKPEYTSEKRIQILITGYGDDAVDILTELQMVTVDDINRHQLNTESNAVFQYFSDISDQPQFLVTDFVEGASMLCDFLTVNSYVPANGTIIESVNVTGEFKKHIDDPDPILVNILEPS